MGDCVLKIPGTCTTCLKRCFEGIKTIPENTERCLSNQCSEQNSITLKPLRLICQWCDFHSNTFLEIKPRKVSVCHNTFEFMQAIVINLILSNKNTKNIIKALK